jgi:hypothetical protein
MLKFRVGAGLPRPYFPLLINDTKIPSPTGLEYFEIRYSLGMGITAPILDQ